MNILLPGQYPRSEKLIAATRDYDRNRISLSELNRQIKEDVSDFKALQKGLPYLSQGLFQWQDLLRPFIHILNGAYAESLTRFYETNTFWRLLEVEGKPSINEAKIDDWIDTYFFGSSSFAKTDPMVFTLPFLYLFKDHSRGIPLETIADLLEKIAKKLVAFPNKSLCFFEPSFGWRKISEEEKKLGKSLLEEIKKSSDAQVFLTTFFFPIDSELEFIFSLPVDGIGIDFYVNSTSCLKKFPKEKKLLAGVLNTESTLLESNESIRSIIEMLRGYIPDDKVFFIPNGPAELLPRDIMDKKVKNLKEIIV